MSTPKVSATVAASNPYALAERAPEYFISHFHPYYFHGYSMVDIILQDFFPRFQKDVRDGFCYTVAALCMLAFRDNPTSCITYAECDDGRRRLRHAWLELCLDGIWWVLDVCAPVLTLRLRNEFYPKNHVRQFYVCNHHEFWRLRVSHQYEEILRNPVTSHLFYELLTDYSWYIGHHTPFHSEISTFSLKPDAGLQLHSRMLLDYPQIRFTRTTVDQYMSAPCNDNKSISEFLEFRERMFRQYLAVCQNQKISP